MNDVCSVENLKAATKPDVVSGRLAEAVVENAVYGLVAFVAAVSHILSAHKHDLRVTARGLCKQDERFASRHDFADKQLLHLVESQSVICRAKHAVGPRIESSRSGVVVGQV